MSPRWLPFSSRGNTNLDEAEKRNKKLKEPEDVVSKLKNPDTSNGKPSTKALKAPKRFGRKGSQPNEQHDESLLPRCTEESASDSMGQQIQAAKDGHLPASRDDQKPEPYQKDITQQTQTVEDSGTRHLAAPPAPVDSDNIPLQQKQIKSYSEEITLT
jgi:hypothetical protein